MIKNSICLYSCRQNAFPIYLTSYEPYDKQDIENKFNYDVIKEINQKDKMTVFLVEQNAYHALKLAHRGYVMVNGVITMSGEGKALLADPQVRAAYLEGGH